MIRRLLLIGFMVAAQLLDARSVLMEPRPAQVGFAEKVHAYVNRVHSQTPQDGVGQVLSKALFFTQQTSMKSVAAILNELGPHLIRDNSVAEKEACSASLIKILVPIVAQFEAALFKGIHTIERSLEYWQYQELHPVSYYFHKSPIKYFTFDQKKEVADKIAMLKKMREQHFELLGNINIRLSSFDTQALVQDQYLWIQKLGHVLFAYDETIHVADDAEIFPLLYEATHLVSNYKTYLRNRLEKYYMPNIIVRRWMELIAAATGAGVAGREVYKWQQLRGTPEAGGDGKREEPVGGDVPMEGGMDEDAQEALTYKQKIKKHWDDAGRVVFGSQDDAKIDTQYSDYVEGLVDLKTVRTDLQEIQEMIKKHGKRSDVTKKMIGFYWKVAFDGARQSGREFIAIFTSLLDQEPSAAERLANRFVVTTDGVRERAASAVDLLDSPPLEDGVPIKQKLPFRALESFFESFSTLKLWFNLKTIEHRPKWLLLRSAPFTLSLTWLTWKGYKLYKKPPSCEPIRVALVDIALLLNVYGDATPEEMDPSDFGRLAYSAHKLELEIGLVPKQYRESFLIEVGLLHTSSLNAQQKIKVIDLMYKKYPFLAFQGMITA